MTVLVTGGAGYIGSHTCVELLQAGFDVLIADNLSNSHPESLKRIEKITGKKPGFVKVDITDRTHFVKVFIENNIDSVIHFAGLKAVGESVELPLKYYWNNIGGTLVLLDLMQRHGVADLVFSSSATVYGNPETVPIREDFPLSATNPYGRSKLMIEDMLRDLSPSRPDDHYIILRYFNPAGAHESGLIGEDPAGIPNNLMPYISQVAVGKLRELSVFGGDYPTPDGTGVRDYIHVVDLARGHVKALEYLKKRRGISVFNLGTGTGYSVLDMVEAFSRVSGRKVPYRITDRRAGDIAECWADPALAGEKLKWRAERTLDDMCRDAWAWQKSNPNGYR